MKNKFVFYIISLYLFGLFFVCCSDNNDSNDKNNVSLGTSKLLSNIYQNGILEDYTNMIALVEKYERILKELKENPTVENLRIAIDEDKKVNIFWENIEIYRLQSLRLLYNDVQFFPLNTSSILNKIDTAKTIDSSFFDILFDPSKGLLANSYILNSLSVKDFINEPKYVDYLIENLSYIKGNIIELEDFWKSEGDLFVSAVGSGLDQSVNLLVNVYINLLETIQLVKLENPLSNKDVSLVESPHNNSSIQLIQSNLTALKTSFNGNFNNSVTLYGFDDYLKAIDREDLSILVNSRIDEAINISLSLNDFNDIITNNPMEVDIFIEKINELLVLFRVDISSALNLTVTFTDNDGD